VAGSLRPDQQAAYLGLPEPLDPRVPALADRVTAGAGVGFFGFFQCSILALAIGTNGGSASNPR